jgi:hypothetical protein
MYQETTFKGSPYWQFLLESFQQFSGWLSAGERCGRTNGWQRPQSKRTANCERATNNRPAVPPALLCVDFRLTSSLSFLALTGLCVSFGFRLYELAPDRWRQDGGDP